MRPIIACTDFSPDATRAIHYAAGLCQATGARLILFHHFTYPIPPVDLPDAAPMLFVDEVAGSFEGRLGEMETALRKAYGIEVDSVVRCGSLQTDLEKVFRDETAGLVVMGMQGQSVLLNTLFGSITSAAIRRGRLPLLVIPREATFRGIRKILFPCNDYTIGSPNTLWALRDLAIALNAYIEVLTLLDMDKRLLHKRETAVPDFNLETLLAGTRHGYAYEEESNVQKGILYEAAKSGANLVAMSPHHHSFFSVLLNQSETQRIAASIDLPLLVLGERLAETDTTEPKSSVSEVA